MTGILLTRRAARWRAPAPIWAEEFDSLDMTTAGYAGRWRANDVWQPVNEGYVDFGSGGSTWNLNPLESLGGAPRSAFTIADSILTMTARLKPAEWAADIAAKGGGGTTHVGGILITNTARSTERFGHGYYAVRARLPIHGKGMFPAIWFFAANGYNTGFENAEIDLFEIFGYAPGKPWSITLHEKEQGGTAAAGATTVDGQVNVATIDTDTTAWHVYGLDWQPNHIRFYQDDVMVAELTGADATFFQGKTMSIRINYAMNASWFPSERLSDGSTPDPVTMDIDWIRVWATKP